VDGASGDFEWDGFIPFDRLPSAFNPPGGIVVTANQNPFPADYPFTVSGVFAPPYRVRQIRALLEKRQGWRAEEMLPVQTDVYSGLAHFVAAQAVAACGRLGAHNPAPAEAVAMLRNWNGQMDKNLSAPFLAELLWRHVRTAAAESAAPGKGLAYSFPMAEAAVERLLRERPAGWFADYDQTLGRALADAVEEGKRIAGGNLGRWRYGNSLRLTSYDPVIHQVPLAGRYFDIGPAPMSGSKTTVKQTTRELGPSMRFTADLADWDRSLLNILFGQSGQIFSSHFRDQWPDYYAGRSYPLGFRAVDAKTTLEFAPAP
jgi:penicillin amidase